MGGLIARGAGELITPVLIVVGIVAGWLATRFIPFGPTIKGLYILSDLIGFNGCGFVRLIRWRINL